MLGLVLPMTHDDEGLMYDRILVPLDGSKFSEEVLPYVRGLAAVHGSAVTLLRVVDRKSDQAEASAYVAQLAAAQGARGLCALAVGDVAEAILEEAEQIPRTLIALTSHGHTGLLQVVLGSVAMRLVRRGGTPVLVYHPIGDGGDTLGTIKVKSVVLPLDGTEFSEAMGQQAAEFARWIGAELLVVGALSSDAAASVASGRNDVLESSYVRTQAERLAEKHGIAVNWEVLHGDPAQAIAGYLGGRRDAVMAMVTHGRGALESVILGSVTAACLRRAGVPVLTRMP